MIAVAALGVLLAQTSPKPSSNASATPTVSSSPSSSWRQRTDKWNWNGSLPSRLRRDTTQSIGTTLRLLWTRAPSEQFVRSARATEQGSGSGSRQAGEGYGRSGGSTATPVTAVSPLPLVGG